MWIARQRRMMEFESRAARRSTCHRVIRLPPSVLRLRNALTLIELTISVAILSITVVALGMMARAVEISSEYNNSYGSATQHARVTLDRLDRAVNQACANKSYPGVWVMEDVVAGYNFPDTLIVWRPGNS